MKLGILHFAEVNLTMPPTAIRADSPHLCNSSSINRHKNVITHQVAHTLHVANHQTPESV